MRFSIDGKKIGPNSPTYFIADIAANHDGNLDKAIELIHLCANNGAHAAKFQNFSADTTQETPGILLKPLGSN